MFDQSNVKYIKRLVVGSDNPARLCTREETEAQMEELNDCLSGASHPRGTLLAVERSFTLVRIGDHQVVLEWMAYHVGFARKPAPKPPRQAPAAAPAPHDAPEPAAAGASRAGSAAEPGEVTDVPSTDVADPA
ncbi:hypothetical protein SAMN05428960_1088 [Mitsuaria sp. PDC51]|jgi:hypothetical protein|uniref:hypothetical protein n=1 Tax=unclassified Roseateles TaxID=2626991 RepID=UPI0008F2963D|nr:MULTISPECIES: hypothetical protein [unclassified Roseateles]SFR75180.1 hypothetical protein SAMN05428960_1088 [Mitsuaria sp. PDC51]